MRAPDADARAPADAAAASALARQKALASGLVILCAVTYATAKAFETRHSAVPYVAAFAEAAIIGALADWYAVVALFRRPLGLALPHTAIIPTNQVRMAEAIGDFIARHFLVGSRVGAKILALDAAASIGRWLAVRDNRRQVAAHAAHILPDAIAAIDRGMLRSAIERGVVERLTALDFRKMLGASLEVITRNQRHHAILDEVLARIEARLAEPGALGALRERIRAELPTLFGLFLADAYLLQRLLRASHALLAEVRSDPLHPLRTEFDRLIAEFLARLKDSPEQIQKVEAIKHELLARAELREVLREGFDRLAALLRADIAREDGLVQSSLRSFLADLARRLHEEAELRARLNQWVAQSAAALTERHKHEVAAFVAAEVKSWDTRQAVRTIELSIGPDLQYIRINGALVGGLIGLALFAATHFAFR